jgi:hypothetical protein
MELAIVTCGITTVLLGRCDALLQLDEAEALALLLRAWLGHLPFFTMGLHNGPPFDGEYLRRLTSQALPG